MTRAPGTRISVVHTTAARGDNGDECRNIITVRALGDEKTRGKNITENRMGLEYFTFELPRETGTDFVLDQNIISRRSYFSKTIAYRFHLDDFIKCLVTINSFARPRRDRHCYT